MTWYVLFWGLIRRFVLRKCSARDGDLGKRYTRDDLCYIEDTEHWANGRPIICARCSPDLDRKQRGLGSWIQT